MDLFFASIQNESCKSFAILLSFSHLEICLFCIMEIEVFFVALSGPSNFPPIILS